MDVRRLGVGEIVAGVAALLLAGAMFLPWWQAAASCDPSTAADCRNPTRTAWEALAVVDVVVVAAIVLVVAAVVATVAQRTAPLPLALVGVAALLSTLALLMVLFRAVVPPDPWPAVDVGPTPASGLFLGVILTAAMAAGTWLAMRDERIGQLGRKGEVPLRRLPGLGGEGRDEGEGEDAKPSSEADGEEAER